MNLKVNDLLCYASTALNVLNNELIVINAIAFYGHGKIKEAKQLLGEILDEDVRWRRGDDRIKSDMQDILDLLSSAQVKGVALPKFVAGSYNSLPPSSGFDLISETLNNLTDEIVRLNQELGYLKDIRNNEVNYKEELKSIKDLIYEINIETKQLKVCNNSISVDLIDIKENIIKNVVNEKVKTSPSVPSAPSESLVFEEDYTDIQANSRSPLKLDNVVKSNQQKKFCVRDASWANVASMNTEKKGPVKGNKLKTSYIDDRIDSENASNIETEITDRENDFTIVNRSRNRKRKNNNFGKKLVNENSKFKSAKHFVDIYIGRCDVNVTVEDVSSYVKAELNTDSFGVIELNSKNSYAKSFKINVLFSDRDKLLSEDVWPDGIIYRKFYSSNKG